MSAIPLSDHEYHIESESVDAEGHHCAECGDLGPNDKLFKYSTVRGRRMREHDGLFCSLDCHDRYYGLKQR